MQSKGDSGSTDYMNKNNPVETESSSTQSLRWSHNQKLILVKKSIPNYYHKWSTHLQHYMVND